MSREYTAGFHLGQIDGQAAAAAGGDLPPVSNMTKVPSVTFLKDLQVTPAQGPPKPRIRYSQLLKSITGGSSSDTTLPRDTLDQDIVKKAFDSSAQPAKPAMKHTNDTKRDPMYSLTAPPATPWDAAVAAASVSYQTPGGAALQLALGGLSIPPPCPPVLPPALAGTAAALAGQQQRPLGVPNPLAVPDMPQMVPATPSHFGSGIADSAASLTATPDRSEGILVSGVNPVYQHAANQPGYGAVAAGTADVTVRLSATGSIDNLRGKYQQHQQSWMIPSAAIEWDERNSSKDVGQQGSAGAMQVSDDEDDVAPARLMGLGPDSTGIGLATVGSGSGFVEGAGTAAAGMDDDTASSCIIIPPGSQQPLPPFWSQLTLRAILVGLLLGFAFVLLNMRLALVTGIAVNLQVVIAGGCWALLRLYTLLLGRDMHCIPPLTAQEVAVSASTALAVASSAAAGGFGSVLLALQAPVAKRVGSSVAGNVPSLVWTFAYWKLVCYLLLVSLSGAMLMLAFRKSMFGRPSMTFATGAAAGQLLNTLHTPPMSYHGHKQMHRFTQWTAISFLFSAYQWVFNNPACNGFRRFPTFGLQALQYTWNFDFQLPFVGLGLLAPVSVAWSMLVGGVVSWGLLWPVFASKEGTWYPEGLQQYDIRGAYGYHLIVALALLLADALYHMIRNSAGAVIERRCPDRCKGADAEAAVPSAHQPSSAASAVLAAANSKDAAETVEAPARATDPGPGRKMRKQSSRIKNAWRREAFRIMEIDTLSDASSLQFSLAAMERALQQHIFVSDGARSWIGIIGFVVCTAAAIGGLPALFNTATARLADGSSARAAAAGSLQFYQITVAGILALFAALANSRGAGIADVSLADAYGKLGMLVFAAWAGSGVGGASTGLVCGGLLLGVSTSAVNALYAWRAGYMTMASPTAVFVAHMVGLGAGCLLAPAAWLVFNAPAVMASAAAANGSYAVAATGGLLASDGFFASPVAGVFRSTAALASGGMSALPQHVLWVGLSTMVVGLAINAVHDTVPGSISALVPIPAAMGVVFLSSAAIAVDVVVGASARVFWRLRYPRSADAYALVVGCALIAGEGLWGLGKTLLAAFGVASPICMTFTMAPAV